MPPRKEPKETVTYSLGSKRPSQAFKPQRPSKQPRVESTESQASASASGSTKYSNSKNVIYADAPARKGTSKQFKAGADRRAGLAQKKNGRKTFVDIASSDEDEPQRAATGSGDEVEDEETTAAIPSDDEGSDDELPVNPLAVKPIKAKPQPGKPTQKKQAPARRKTATVPDPVSSPMASDPPRSPPPMPSQSEGPGVPQPLLVRLMHEHFADKSTKIDKHAIQVLQKYFEVYVREAIARTAQWKSEQVADGKAGQEDEKWLELEDLEGVAAGMGLDF